MLRPNFTALPVALFLSAAFLTPVSALQVAENLWFGTILTDDAGRAVYVTSGPRDCVEECRLLWTPVPLEAVASTDVELDARQVGVTRGPLGEVQATFSGRPLFYFVEDFVPGDTNGQQFDEFGRVGFLITPDGIPVNDAMGDECGCQTIEVAQN